MTEFDTATTQPLPPITGPLHVYTPHQYLHHPAGLFRKMLLDLRASRGFAWEMARRNIASQYRQSLLGVLLAFFPVIVVACWCTLIRHARVIQIQELDLPYPAFVLISMVLWTTFVESLSLPIDRVLAERGLLAKSPVPPESIILAAMLEVGFNFLVKLVVIVLAVAWYRLPISWMVVFSPVGVLLLILLGSAMGMILAPLNLLYRDISRSLVPITTFWLFLTPVLFPVPESGLAGVIVAINPVTPLLQAVRETATLGVLSHPWSFAITAALTLVTLVVGWLFYRIALPVVLDQAAA